MDVKEITITKEVDRGSSPQSRVKAERTPDDGQKLTPADEICSSVTHFFGFLLGVWGAKALFADPAVFKDIFRFASSSIYSASLLFAYAASFISHATYGVSIRKKAEIADFSAIYLFIAGTYTPYLLMQLRGALGWGTLTSVWTFALGGVTNKIVSVARFRIAVSMRYTIMSYVFLGWLSLLYVPVMVRVLPLKAVYLTLAGVISYSIGGVIMNAKKIPMHHTIWHIFAMLGSACHFFVIYNFVLI